MLVIRHITAKQLGATSLALWCCSLTFTGLVLYSSQKHLPGFEILLMGWLSPLALNFAWFANVFFLYGMICLLSGGVPVKSAILSTLLSFDTFRFSHYLLNEGGATTPVYGYGWGAVLWFASIFLMLAAVGTQRRETNTSKKLPDMQESLRSIGFFLLSITLVASSYLAIHDRIVANSSEAQRLAKIAFKRGKVCGAPEPAATNPLRKLSGPIELVIEKNALHANYPFAQIEDLLEWGIPMVRSGNIDYSYESTAGDRLLASTPATGAPIATLTVNESRSLFIRARLVENQTNQTVFDQTWTRENDTDYYCPDYHSFPSMNEQPRRLLMQALNLHQNNGKTESPVQHQEVFDRVEGSIIERKDGGKTRAMKEAKWKEMNPDRKSGFPYHEVFNTNCPSSVGWDGTNYESSQNTGWPFIVAGKSYYLRHRERYNAICEGDFAYIYYGTARDGNYYLNAEARDLRNFQQVWAKIIVVPGVSPSLPDDILKMQSVKQSTHSATIELVNEKSGEVLVVQVPLNDK